MSAASLFHLAWAQVLARVSGRQDVVFGTVLFGRMQGGEGADRAVGLFINTLPVRVPAGDEGAEASVRRTHGLLAELLRHEHASLALAQRCSGVPAPAPLFTALLNYRHSAASGGSGGLGGHRSAGRGGAHQLSADAVGGRLGRRVRADGADAAEVGAERVCGFMQTALEGLVAALEQCAGDAGARLGVLPEAERHRVVEEWNETAADYPPEQCIHELFEAQAARTPDAVAVVYEDRQLTYGELNAQANRLAHHLRGLGVGPDERVAICVERRLEMVVACWRC